MRIKNYDYETVIKLKNPLRDFDEVKNFVLAYVRNNNCKDELNNDYAHGENLELVNCYQFEGYDCFVYNDKLVFEEQICFCTTNTNNLFYRVYRDRVSSFNEKEFGRIKQLFINYKLNEHLNKNLVTKVEKKKTIKI